MIYGLVAVEQNQGIGFNNSMPWPHLKGDMRWFARTTKGHIVIMGSNTWTSIGNALPDRINVVISSRLHVASNHTYSDPIEAIQDLQERYRNKDIYIIGGAQLYNSVKELIDVYFVTEIDASYHCDKFFDLEFVKNKFNTVTELQYFPATEVEPAYTIKEYKNETV